MAGAVPVLVTRTDHCLHEVLWRTKLGELPVEITSVIGNREDCRSVSEQAGIRFHSVEMDGAAREAGFETIRGILHDEKVELVVLARFMQILPNAFCREFEGRVINIHHSFLPSFVGAKPYHQAYTRGVKLIGATCHYVTEALDQGPIIEQDVIRIDHSDSVEDMVRYGKDIEKAVLARALRYHIEDRVLTHGNKTVVFR